MENPALARPAPHDTGRSAYPAHRNPVLLFRFTGSFLLRFETRTFCGLLFQEPPRISAMFPSRQCNLTEQLPPQTPRIAEPGMAQPRLEPEPPGMILLGEPSQPPPDPHHIRPQQPRPVRKEPPAQKCYSVLAPPHPKLTQLQSAFNQAGIDRQMFGHVAIRPDEKTRDISFEDALRISLDGNHPGPAGQCACVFPRAPIRTSPAFR